MKCLALTNEVKIKKECNITCVFNDYVFKWRFWQHKQLIYVLLGMKMLHPFYRSPINLYFCSWFWFTSPPTVLEKPKIHKTCISVRNRELWLFVAEHQTTKMKFTRNYKTISQRHQRYWTEVSGQCSSDLIHSFIQPSFIAEPSFKV